MNGRGLTNILLAIITGVLLFGRDAMTSGLQGVAIVAAIIFTIWLALLVVGGILGWIGSEWRAAKTMEDRLNVVFATVAGFILTPLGAYVAWLWATGDEAPIHTAAFSPLGYAWMGLLLILLAGYAIYWAGHGVRWLSEHRSEVPRIVAYRLRLLCWGYLEFLCGPVTFPIREWRFREAEGAGPVVKAASAAYCFLLGLIVCLMTASLTVLAGYGVLSTLGMLD